MPARILPYRRADQPFTTLLSKRHAEEARAMQATPASEPSERDHSRPYGFRGGVWAWIGGPHGDDFNPGGSAA